MSRWALAALVAVALCGCARRPEAVNPPAVAKHPDWSGGLWVRDEDPGRGDIGTMRGDSLPLTTAWRAKSDALSRIHERHGAVPSNGSRCIPSGMPYMMMSNSLEFVSSPGRIGIIVSPRAFQIRNIFVDGRAHTADEFLFDTYSGESIGHWEGDTLVIDTIGLLPTNELVAGLPGTKLHTTERFREVAAGKLEIVTTVTDPEALATPWTYVNTYVKHPERFTVENYCVAAYDRSVDPQTGEQGFDLTPPPEEGVGVPQSLTHRKKP